MPLAATLQEHVRMIPRHDIVYSIPEFVLKWGRQWPTNEDTYKGRRMKMHLCYYNSAIMAMMDPMLTYVEGFIECLGIPIMHAWCVDAEGFVIDLTLTPPLEHIGDYFGVPFETDYVINKAVKTRYWESVIDMNRVLLTRTDTLPEGVMEWD